MRKKITKPRQAASARQLDRWKLIVQAAMEDVNQMRELADFSRVAPTVVERLGDRLSGLLRSMRKAERR